MARKKSTYISSVDCDKPAEYFGELPSPFIEMLPSLRKNTLSPNYEKLEENSEKPTYEESENQLN